MQQQPRYTTPKGAKGGAPAAQQRYPPLTFSKAVAPAKSSSSKASSKKGATGKPSSKSAGSSKRVVAPQPSAQPPYPQAGDESTDDSPRSSGWTPEQLADAKANSQEFFDAPLNEAGSRRVRVTTFGSTVGIDLREFFEGQYGDLKGQWLPSGRGFRLRIDEWEALKAVSGHIDEALGIIADGQSDSMQQ